MEKNRIAEYDDFEILNPTQEIWIIAKKEKRFPGKPIIDCDSFFVLGGEGRLRWKSDKVLRESGGRDPMPWCISHPNNVFYFPTLASSYQVFFLQHANI